MTEVMTWPDSRAELQARYRQDGYVVVRSLFPRATIMSLRARAESLLAPQSEAAQRSVNRHVQTVFDRQGAVKLVKASGLVEHDAGFHTMGADDRLVDVVESLLGEPARRFRDVLVVKPARTGGALSYHQDSAYWDVEPKSLVSAWVCLGDVGTDGSCLCVVPGSHRSEVEHGIYLRGLHPLPPRLTRGLRRLVSMTGTGDNPKAAGGSGLAWRLKRFVLAGMTRHLPILFDLQDFRIPPELVDRQQERPLPLTAGDVVFFHSLLWHASGPNRSESARFAEIISFMGVGSRFVGHGGGHFPLARKP